MPSNKDAIKLEVADTEVYPLGDGELFAALTGPADQLRLVEDFVERRTGQGLSSQASFERRRHSRQRQPAGNDIQAGSCA